MDSRSSDNFEPTLSALRVVHSATYGGTENLIAAFILDLRQKSSDERWLKNYDTLHPIFNIAHQ